LSTRLPLRSREGGPIVLCGLATASAVPGSGAPHKKKHVEIGDPRIERGILTGGRDRH
jgi:hypothetical protein